MFEQNAKNNKDVIKECHNAFLEKYLEKNRIGRKSKFQSAIKCKASGSPGYTSRSYTSEKMSKAKLSKSLDATSRSYSSSLSSNLIACALNEDVGETSLSNFDILNSDQTGVDNKNTMSAVSNKPIITDKLAMVINNSLSQQCYSLNLNSLNFHDEASYSSNSIHNGASFRHTSSFSEYYTPTSHGSLTASYVDHQRQNFNQLDTLNENVVDNSNFNNNINYSYVNRVNTDSYANSSGTRMNNILSNSNGHNYGYAANLNEDKYLMARNDVEGWQSGSNMRQHNQHLNEEELKSFNYETESK
jgi:predicted HD phosphohydrolase